MGTTVGRKLATAFVAMLMMFGLAASWVFVDLVRIHEDQDRIEQVLNPFSAAMTDVLVGTEAAANDERGFLLTGERAFIDVIEQQQLPKVAAALDDLERLGVEPDLVAVLRDQIDAWVASMFAEFDAFASDPEAARSMAFGPTRALRTTHETTAADLQAKATASLDGASRYLTSTTETAQVRIFLAFALGLSGAVVVVLLLSRHLRTRIQTLIGRTGEIESGDLSGTPLAMGGQDELAQLAASIDRMQSVLASFARTTSASSSQVSGAAGELVDLSTSLNSVSEAIDADVDSAGGRGREVSQAVDTTRVAMDELRESIEEIARRAVETADTTTQAVELAGQSESALGSLTESSERIGSILDVIGSIAEQTNLLALNATIEAARAGDAGKGFSVVAGEVKELAQQTTAATRQIAEMVSAIQERTAVATTANARTGSLVERIDALAGAIASAVEEQAATVGQVALTLNDVGTSVHLSEQALAGIRERAAESTRSARSARDAAEFLQRSAAELEQLASEYR
ncbi:MAG: methyl-accepting chemotaxis protein [Ilumatobacteraceae bacterium]